MRRSSFGAAEGRHRPYAASDSDVRAAVVSISSAIVLALRTLRGCSSTGYALLRGTGIAPSSNSRTRWAVCPARVYRDVYHMCRCTRNRCGLNLPHGHEPRRPQTELCRYRTHSAASVRIERRRSRQVNDCYQPQPVVRQEKRGTF